VTRSRNIDGRPLFVAGFMGTGKSTVGSLLATRLSRTFVDLDERIVEEAQATIAELFVAEGEAGFRKREAEMLARVCKEGGVVVAVGGGAPCFGDNLDKMLAAGVVVGLNATAEEILTRIGDASTRPLLARAIDRPAEIARLTAERGPYYARVDFTVDTTGVAPSQVLGQILKELGL